MYLSVLVGVLVAALLGSATGISSAQLPFVLVLYAVVTACSIKLFHALSAVLDGTDLFGDKDKHVYPSTLGGWIALALSVVCFLCSYLVYSYNYSCSEEVILESSSPKVANSKLRSISRRNERIMHFFNAVSFGCVFFFDPAKEVRTILKTLAESWKTYSTLASAMKCMPKWEDFRDAGGDFINGNGPSGPDLESCLNAFVDPPTSRGTGSLVNVELQSSSPSLPELNPPDLVPSRLPTRSRQATSNNKPPPTARFRRMLPSGAAVPAGIMVPCESFAPTYNSARRPAVSASSADPAQRMFDEAIKAQYEHFLDDLSRFNNAAYRSEIFREIPDDGTVIKLPEFDPSLNFTIPHPGLRASFPNQPLVQFCISKPVLESDIDDPSTPQNSLARYNMQFLDALVQMSRLLEEEDFTVWQVLVDNPFRHEVDEIPVPYVSPWDHAEFTMSNLLEALEPQIALRRMHAAILSLAPANDPPHFPYDDPDIFGDDFLSYHEQNDARVNRMHQDEMWDATEVASRFHLLNPQLEGDDDSSGDELPCFLDASHAAEQARWEAAVARVRPPMPREWHAIRLARTTRSWCRQWFCFILGHFALGCAAGLGAVLWLYWAFLEIQKIALRLLERNPFVYHSGLSLRNPVLEADSDSESFSDDDFPDFHEDDDSHQLAGIQRLQDSGQLHRHGLGYHPQLSAQKSLIKVLNWLRTPPKFVWKCLRHSGRVTKWWCVRGWTRTSRVVSGWGSALVAGLKFLTIGLVGGLIALIFNIQYDYYPMVHRVMNSRWNRFTQSMKSGVNRFHVWTQNRKVRLGAAAITGAFALGVGAAYVYRDPLKRKWNQLTFGKVVGTGEVILVSDRPLPTGNYEVLQVSVEGEVLPLYVEVLLPLPEVEGHKKPKKMSARKGYRKMSAKLGNAKGKAGNKWISTSSSSTDDIGVEESRRTMSKRERQAQDDREDAAAYYNNDNAMNDGMKEGPSYANAGSGYDPTTDDDRVYTFDSHGRVINPTAGHWRPDVPHQSGGVRFDVSDEDRSTGLFSKLAPHRFRKESIDLEHLRMDRAIITPPILYRVVSSDPVNPDSKNLRTGVCAFPAAGSLFIPRHGVAGKKTVEIYGTPSTATPAGITRLVSSIPDQVAVLPGLGFPSFMNRHKYSVPQEGESVTLFWIGADFKPQQSSGTVGRTQNCNGVMLTEFDGSSLKGACGGVYVSNKSGHIVGFHGVGSGDVKECPHFYPISEEWISERSKIAQGKIKYDHAPDVNYEQSYVDVLSGGRAVIEEAKFLSPIIEQEEEKYPVPLSPPALPACMIPLPDSPPPSAWPCPRCTKTFSDEKFAAQHLKDAHKAPTLTVIEETEEEISAAPEENPVNIKFKCSSCGELFPSQNARKVHRHKSHPVAVPASSPPPASTSELPYTPESKPTEKPKLLTSFKCKDCVQIFKSADDLAKHTPIHDQKCKWPDCGGIHPTASCPLAKAEFAKVIPSLEEDASFTLVEKKKRKDPVPEECFYCHLTGHGRYSPATCPALNKPCERKECDGKHKNAECPLRKRNKTESEEEEKKSNL